MSKTREQSDQIYLFECLLRQTHLLITKQDSAAPLLTVTIRGKTMLNRSQRTLIAVITAFGIASSGTALAQSAYTTGTEASSAAAGYPSPYGGGPYAYAPGPVRAAAPVAAGGCVTHVANLTVARRS